MNWVKYVLRRSLQWPWVWPFAADICALFKHEPIGFCLPCAAIERRKKPPVIPAVIYEAARIIEPDKPVGIQNIFWDDDDA